MDNRNQELFKALRKVETSDVSASAPTSTTFMSVADYKANRPEGEVDVREVVQGNDTESFNEALDRLRRLLDEFQALEHYLWADEIEIIIALLTGAPLPDTSSVENSMKYGEARPLASKIVDKLVENERVGTIDELVEGYEDSKEFMDTYLSTILDLFDYFGVTPEDEQDVLSAILDVLSDYTTWFEVED